jgi:SynChlorMet cassette protein ScmC
MLLALYPIFERAQNSGGVPFHAALLERNGIAVLLVAPGSTGKSTCCIRLRSPWQPLCDDETLIVRDLEKRYLAHPFPTWSDYLMKRSTKTWNIEYHLPLSAIFFMEQAETEEVLPIGQGEAAAYIHHSAMQVCRRRLYHLNRRESKSLRLKLFDNACELSRAIPAFKLGVSLKGRFWEKIEAVLP